MERVVCLRCFPPTTSPVRRDGRRALRNIKSEIACRAPARTGRLAQSVGCPGLVWQSGPLEVEIGSGKGLFCERRGGLPELISSVIEGPRSMPPLPPPDWPSAVALREDRAATAGSVAERFRANALRACTSISRPLGDKRHKKRRVLNEPFLRVVTGRSRPADRPFLTVVEEYLKVRSG